MINFNRKNVNLISLIISIIIFFILISFIKYPKVEKNISIQNENNNTIKDTNKEKIPETWKIQIKALNMEGTIKQMKSDTPYQDSISHFKETTILGNNVGLIAYNYGKEKNYFANLKELEIGERIIYIVDDNKKEYKVISNKIIEKNSLKNVLKVNNKYESYLKLFTYIKDLDTKLRYVCAKEIIDR